MAADAGRPEGDVYDWYVRGLALLNDGHAAAAEQLLVRAHDAEPTARNILEALARARLSTRQYDQARADFARLVEVQPDDDYARLGLGLALARLDRFEEASEQLALAVAMRPDRADYDAQLQQERATLAERLEYRVRLSRMDNAIPNSIVSVGGSGAVLCPPP